MPLDNPFQDPLRFERKLSECAVVIFGANGDLTKSKLLPALYRLAHERRARTPERSIFATPNRAPSAPRTAAKVCTLGFPFSESARYRLSRFRPERAATLAMPPCA